MADCHALLIDFNETITLHDSRRKSLKKSRKSIRDRIRAYFRENRPNQKLPKFHSQGSFEMNIGVNPIGRQELKNGEKKTVYKYDVDDGIYFIEEQGNRLAIQTYHDWIYDAVDGHTDEDPIDKNTCVRVLFHDGHNIDLPIYFLDEGETGAIPELAHRDDGWIDSDPRAFVIWFTEKAEDKPQLCQLARYLKAWCDYQNYQADTRKMPSGLVMTIWVAENAVLATNRDDMSLRDTLQAIHNLVNNDDTYRCDRPTVPVGEDLLANYAHKDFFKERLKEFLESAQQASKETNHKEACLKWQKHFGSRFPCHLAEDRDEQADTFATPYIIPSNAKGA